MNASLFSRSTASRTTRSVAAERAAKPILDPADLLKNAPPSDRRQIAFEGTGMGSACIAEIEFDLRNSTSKMIVRLYAPENDQPNGDWSCVFEIGDPISVRRTTYGVSSMQALVLTLKAMASYLYSSDEYRNNEIGLYGEFDGDLSIPAPVVFQDLSAYRF